MQEVHAISSSPRCVLEGRQRSLYVRGLRRQSRFLYVIFFDDLISPPGQVCFGTSVAECPFFVANNCRKIAFLQKSGGCCSACVTLWDKLRKAHNAQRRVETTFRVGRSLANVKTRLAIKFTVIPSTPRVISSNV
jgi:hypothetical protein